MVSQCVNNGARILARLSAEPSDISDGSGSLVGDNTVKVDSLEFSPGGKIIHSNDLIIYKGKLRL